MERLPSDESLRTFVNLADARLGASIVSVTDEFFGPAERLLRPEPPEWRPGVYDDHGKWMDGWESRRRREPGHDQCVVRLFQPGVVRGLDLDTTHFRGNFPPEAAVEACHCDAVPDEQGRWLELLQRTPIEGDGLNPFAVACPEPVTHVRLHIFPDGGIARLRVYGEVQRDWASLADDAVVDLVSVTNGGRALACSNEFFGAMRHLLLPGRGRDMGDGWETRRRRGPGHDWVILRLGHPGNLESIEVDTAHFKGNYPESVAVQGAAVADGSPIGLDHPRWRPVLPRQKLEMDRIHVFADELLATPEPITHARIDIHPDGGLSRVRLNGRPARSR